MKHLTCGYCKKELNTSMEIEYSDWLTEYFCNPDCAIGRYFDYMGSKPFDWSDKKALEKDGIKIIDGKLFIIE